MVKKLYKHEFLAWLRVVPIIFCITLLSAGFHRILQLFETDSVYYRIVSGSLLVVFSVALLATLAAPVIFGIVRFYKNLFTGEGYLTFTLPVKTTTHLLVKTTTNLVFCIAAFLVCIASFCLITAGDVFAEICKAAAYIWKDIPQKYVGHTAAFIAEFLTFLLLATIASTLLFDACLCVGQLAKKNRILLAVGAYFIYYIATQIIGTVLVVGATVLELAGKLQPIYDYIQKNPLPSVHIGFAIASTFYILLSAIFWFISRGILRKKLNLE